jgi:DNA polymerase-3 subunit alpha
MKILVKEGWTNQGVKKTEQIQFVWCSIYKTSWRPLQLLCLLNIKDLEAEFIHKLGHLFYDNKGDNQVSFEIMELKR